MFSPLSSAILQIRRCRAVIGRGGFSSTKALNNISKFSRQCTLLTPIRAPFAGESAQTKSPVEAYPALRGAVRDASLPRRRQSVLFRIPDVTPGSGNDPELSFGLTRQVTHQFSHLCPKLVSADRLWEVVSLLPVDVVRTTWIRRD